MNWNGDESVLSSRFTIAPGHSSRWIRSFIVHLVFVVLIMTILMSVVLLMRLFTVWLELPGAVAKFLDFVYFISLVVAALLFFLSTTSSVWRLLRQFLPGLGGRS